MIGFYQNGLTWILDPSGKLGLLPQKTPRYIEALGLLPGFLESTDRRSAQEQFTERYSRGLILTPMTGVLDEGGIYISPYEEDPPLAPYAKTTLPAGESVLIYKYGIVAIVQEDGRTFVTRMD